MALCRVCLRQQATVIFVSTSFYDLFVLFLKYLRGNLSNILCKHPLELLAAERDQGRSPKPKRFQSTAKTNFNFTKILSFLLLRRSPFSPGVLRSIFSNFHLSIFSFVRQGFSPSFVSFYFFLHGNETWCVPYVIWIFSFFVVQLDDNRK